MTQYSNFIIKLSNSQLNKLKLGIKNGTEVPLIILMMQIIFRINCS